MFTIFPVGLKNTNSVSFRSVLVGPCRKVMGMILCTGKNSNLMWVSINKVYDLLCEEVLPASLDLHLSY